MLILELFWSFFQIGLFSVGGGYAAMPLIQHQIVDIHPWLSMTEFADIMTIAEMTPGPVAINAATFVGIRTAGIPGALAATFGCILPSLVIVLAMAWLYHRYRQLRLLQGVLGGLRPAVVAMIASAGLSLLMMALFGQRTIPTEGQMPDWIAVLLFCAGIAAMRKWKPNPICVMAGCGLAGLILYTVF